MASDEKQQAKDDLLHELESLRAQLADPDNSDFSDGDIPILLDKVEQAIAATPDVADPAEQLDDETAALQAAYQEATNGLPQQDATAGADSQQQSLFTLSDSEHSVQPSAPPRPMARGENPFLPKHIRDRLSERRQLLADDIAQASSFFPSRSQTRSSALRAEHQKLIDDLVADYLPRIERDLRHRLQQLLERSAGEQEDR